MPSTAFRPPLNARCSPLTSIASIRLFYCTRNFFWGRNIAGGAVLEFDMRRHFAITSLAAAALAITLALPAASSAAIQELGELGEGLRGSCPDAGVTAVPVPPDESCQALTKLTGYQAKVGPDRSLYKAPAKGRIVAWTIALGKPGPKQTEFFVERFGRTSQAAVVVLSPRKNLVRKVVAKAPMEDLDDWFGQVVQFPLKRSLPINKGQYVGLTVPTWAPAMQLGLASGTSWRASRDKSGCGDVTTQFGLLGRRRSATFHCLYKGVRMTYSATFISDPVKPSSETKDK